MNLNSVRQEKIEERRRDYERVVFKSNFGVYSYGPETNLHALEVIDISEGGMLFQVSDRSAIRFDVGTVVPLRFYFSTDSYIGIDVKVVRAFTSIEGGQPMQRYGCLIDKTMASYAALFHFVQFIAKCAEHGHKDEKHNKVFY